MIIKDLEDIEPSVFLRSALRKADRQVQLELHGKPYLIDQKAFLAHLRADALVHTALVAGVMELQFALAKRFKQKNTGNVSVDVTPWLSNFTRAVSYTSITRLLERYSTQNLPDAITDKLVKDIFKSSLRKYCRYQSKVAVAQRMVTTAAKASFLSILSVFIVEEIVLAWKASTGHDILRGTWWNLFRALGAIAGSSLGAALGSLYEPGFGTVVGAGLGQIVLTVVSPADRVFPNAHELFEKKEMPLIVEIENQKYLLE
ncbi:hypothetical protein THRCLA_04781 [Thraustotheca clavata]|uniref:Uncharacterized protein n=1 Tax=Thraustotheca clavata TaxID=74557 RepID=A0A1V9ZY01_9STRA|nr:hypothetical protein THRCLA_04781 [Thraustotheca clavata]